jgi:putative nucleotidyltransferase with HDIG domain
VALETGPKRGRYVAATTYVTAVALGGSVAVALGFADIIRHAPPIQVVVLLGLTLLSGSATLTMPSIPVSFSISDTFTMTAALLFGPSVGTLIVAADSLAICLRARIYRPRRLIFNATAPPLAMWIAAQLFFALAKVGPLSVARAGIWQLLLPFVLFVSTYFVFNTGLIAGAVSLETGQRVARIWKEHFLGLWVSYFGGGLVGVLLVLLVYQRNPDLTALTLVVPLPLILYAMFRKSMQHAEDRIAHLDKVNRLYHSTIEALAQAIDAKDQVTHGHIRRVQRYSARLAAAIGVTDENELKALEAASLLHDTGKLAIPEYILNKPDKLTKGEFEHMKRHAAIGADILSSIEFPFPVVPIVRHHHENWNGSGYPDGLKQTAIPLGARILSVIDCFDALTSDRPYRRKLSDSAALDILRERRGTMYDPAVVDAFVAAHAQGVFRDDVSESNAGDIMTRASTEARIHDEHEAERHEPPYFALFDFASAIAGASDPGSICDAVCEHFKTEFSVSSCVLFEYRDTTHELVASFASGAHARALRRLAIPLGERISGWVAANRASIFNSDAALDLETLVLSLDDPPRRCLAVPLVTDGALVGVLTVYSKDDSAFGGKDATVMTVVADRIAPMVKAAFAVRRLEDVVGKGRAEVR